MSKSNYATGSSWSHSKFNKKQQQDQQEGSSQYVFEKNSINSNNKDHEKFNDSTVRSNKSSKFHSLGRKSMTKLSLTGADAESDPLLADKSLANKRKQKFLQQSKEYHRKSKLDFGLVSRGEDSRLQENESLRKLYFAKIQKSFIQYCYENKDKEFLRLEFERLSLNEKNEESPAVQISTSQQREENEKITLDSILLSLRKLRESLLKQKPGSFGKEVFLYSIRISTKIGNYETYLPSINYLLKNSNILSSHELEEIASYLILHVSHFNNDNLKAFNLYYNYIPKKYKILEILKSWCNNDFLTWKKLWDKELFNLNNYRIMKFGEDKILSYYLYCIGKSYFVFSKKDLERITGHDWVYLQKKFILNWKYDKDSSPDTIQVRERVKR